MGQILSGCWGWFQGLVLFADISLKKKTVLFSVGIFSWMFLVLLVTQVENSILKNQYKPILAGKMLR